MRNTGMKLIVLALCTFMLAGCFFRPSVTFSHRLITEDERQLIYAAGGMDALHFIADEELSKGEAIQFSIEHYEKGNLVGTLAEMTWNGGDGTKAHIGFGVQPAAENELEQIIFSGLQERAMPELEAIPGGSALVPLADEETTLKQGKAVYLAYYIVSSDGRVETVNLKDESYLTQLQAYDRCLLLKAEWAK